MFVLISTANVFPQFYCDTAKGYVGDYINVPIHYINNGDSISQFKIIGSFYLSNPTVFFPNQFITAIGTITKNSSITRMSDSIYNFELGISNITLLFKDTLTFYLSGELLAGYDTVCFLKFFDVKFDINPVNNFYDTVYSNTKGSSLRYVRLPHLQEGIPNPVWAGSSAIWNYNIDKPSDVIFIVYNILGEAVLERKFFSLAGFQQFALSFDNTFPAGYYLLKFSSNSGDDFQPFIILK